MQDFCKEVCVDNVKDAMRAVDLGANRIEYCSKLSEEGLAPDIEDVKYLLKNIKIRNYKFHNLDIKNKDILKIFIKYKPEVMT